MQCKFIIHRALKASAFWRVAVCALLVGTLSTGGSAATVVGGPFVNPDNGHTYLLLTPSSWQEAQADAVKLRGNLTTINDAAEQNWVFATFGSFGGTNRSLWIGLYRDDLASPFKWVDGEPVSYTHWLPGQPDSNPFGPELFTHMLNTGNAFGAAPGYWNDLASPNIYYPAFDPLQGVVEIAAVPEPATWLSLLLGIGALLRKHQRASSERIGTASGH